LRAADERAAAVSAPRGVRGQASRFAVVGVTNTLIDYVVFIGLTKIFSIPLDWVWVAKAASGGVAITNSFILNRHWVFRGRGRIVREGGAFVTVTVIGVYLIQTPLTQFFSSVYPAPGELAYDIVQRIGVTDLLPDVVTEPFMVKTTAFALATAASMTWNFLAYRHVVFGRRRLPFEPGR
jgi:putative flippase GtrA